MKKVARVLFVAVIFFAVQSGQVANAQGKLFLLVVADTEDVVDPDALQGPLFRVDFYGIQSVLRGQINDDKAALDVKTVAGQSFTIKEFDNKLRQVINFCQADDAITGLLQWPWLILQWRFSTTIQRW